MKCGNMQLHQSRKTKRGPAASDDQALGASTHGSSFGNASLMCCRLRCFCSSRFIPKMNMRLQVLHHFLKLREVQRLRTSRKTRDLITCQEVCLADQRSLRFSWRL